MRYPLPSSPKKKTRTALDVIREVNRSPLDFVPRVPKPQSKADQLRIRKNITPYKKDSGPPLSGKNGGSKADQLRIRKNVTPYKKGSGPPLSGSRSVPVEAAPKKAPYRGGSKPAPAVFSPSPTNRPTSRPTTPAPKLAPARKLPIAKAPAPNPDPRGAQRSFLPVPNPTTQQPTTQQPTAQAPNADPYEEFRQQATSIYQPQLNYLTGLENTNRGNAATADTAIGDMYGKLERDIRGRIPSVGENYNSAIADVNKGVDTAKANINANYDASRNAQAEVLKRLGIQEAAPQTLAQQGSDQAYYTSAQDNARGAATNLLSTLRAADTDFTGAQANISAQTGVDKRVQVQRDLQNILGQLSGKRADAQSSISSQIIAMKNQNDDRLGAQANMERDDQLARDRMDNDSAIAQDQIVLARDRMANDSAIAQAKLNLQAATTQKEYDFKNRQLQQALQLGNGNLALGQQRLAQQQEASRGQLLLGQSRLSTETQNAQRSNAAKIKAAQIAAAARASGGKAADLDPWTKVESAASRLYPNSRAAGNAVNAVRDTIVANTDSNGEGIPPFSSAADFIRAVADRNRRAFQPGGDGPQLTKLATMIYKDIYGPARAPAKTY